MNARSSVVVQIFQSLFGSSCSADLSNFRISFATDGGVPGSRETASRSSRSTFLENCSLRVSRVNLITRNTAVKLFTAANAFRRLSESVCCSVQRLSQAPAIRLSYALELLVRSQPAYAACLLLVSRSADFGKRDVVQ